MTPVEFSRSGTWVQGLTPTKLGTWVRRLTPQPPPLTQNSLRCVRAPTPQPPTTAIVRSTPPETVVAAGGHLSPEVAAAAAGGGCRGHCDKIYSYFTYKSLQYFGEKNCLFDFINECTLHNKYKKPNSD